MSDVNSDNVSPFDTAGLLTENFRFAFLVFSLVPVLGILFSIPAIALYVFAVRKHGDSLDKKLAVLSVIIFGMQIVLWSLLYLAPKLAISAI